jgi:hypothetical protein
MSYIWTDETEHLFDELVAGLPEGAQRVVRDYATDASEFQPVEEAVAEGALMATHGWHEVEEEPAWDRDAVVELLRLISVDPDWLTPDGIKLLADEAENRSRVNGNDTVTEGDVREAFDACS